MQLRIAHDTRYIRLFPRLGTMVAGAALSLLLFASGAQAAPAQTATASSGNFSAQHAYQDQDTTTIAVPITALSGNAVSLFGRGATTANNFSGVVVAPSQSSAQRSTQTSSADASNSSHGSNKDYDSGSRKHGDGQQAGAVSGNFNSQRADQRQDTLTVAVPVTVASGNAVSVGGHGKTSSSNDSGVVAAPSQSSVQRSTQSSHATARNTSKHVTHKYDKRPYTANCSGKDSNGKGKHDTYGGKHGPTQRAYAASHNYSSQHATQRQNTVTVAVPVTVASGNAISIIGGKTTSHNNSGVTVVPSQSSSQHSSQQSGASATNFGQ